MTKMKHNRLQKTISQPFKRDTYSLACYTPHGKKNGKMPFIIKNGVAKTKDHGKWETTDTSDFSAKDYKKPLNMINKENFRKTAKYQQKDGLVHVNLPRTKVRGL